MYLFFFLLNKLYLIGAAPWTPFPVLSGPATQKIFCVFPYMVLLVDSSFFDLWMSDWVLWKGEYDALWLVESYLKLGIHVESVRIVSAPSCSYAFLPGPYNQSINQSINQSSCNLSDVTSFCPYNKGVKNTLDSIVLKLEASLLNPFWSNVCDCIYNLYGWEKNVTAQT